MKSLRDSSMIAAALSIVRPGGRRRGVTTSTMRTDPSDHQFGAGESALTRVGTDVPSELNSIPDRSAPMSYSLIGW
jgi:hypothetical protein